MQMQMQMQMHTMDEWNGRRLKSFMCLAVGSLLLILLLNYFYGERNPYSMDVLLGGFVARSSSSLTSMVTRRLNNNRTSDNCEPVRAVDDQYYATFDGVRYPRHVPLYHNRSIDFACLNADGQVKKILYWNGFFGDKSFEYGLGVKQPFVANNCPVTNCETFYDRQRIAESDLILVHMRDSVGQLPTPRGANERWVFALYESPVHAGDYSNLDGLFNLTSTYAVESDFPDFYSSDSKFRWQLNETFDPQHDYSAGKPGFAAAVVSNCGGPSRRLEYIKELQKHIAVDVFGNCGRKCPTSYRSSGQPGECKDILAHEYRFYFAFENSVCKDYITEKFFLILNKNIIPVVLGGGSYDYYIPKSGYINALDFQTPKALATYLTYLSTNATAYNAYFQWKKHVTFYTSAVKFSPICSMCIQLHLESRYGVTQKSIKNIGTYWTRNDCKSPRISHEDVFDFEKI